MMVDFHSTFRLFVLCFYGLQIATQLTRQALSVRCGKCIVTLLQYSKQHKLI